MSIRIIVIDNYETFVKQEEPWNRVYGEDPNVNIFLSWSWLKARFEIDHAGLYILAAKNEENDYVAFWPLKLNKMTKFKIITVNTTLQAAGAPYADYTGLLCLPRHESSVLQAFVDHLKTKLPWQSLQINDCLDERFNRLFSSLGNNVQVETSETLCPHMELPADWDTYLSQAISKPTRKRLRKNMKNIMEQDDFHFETLTAENMDRNLEAAIGLWSRRWEIKSEKYLSNLKKLLYACAQEGVLWLNAIWQKANPVAIQVGFADRHKRVLYAYFSGFNDDFADYSPGAVLKGWGIKRAIETGYKTYDFLRGAESYKYSFGAHDRIATTYRIENQAEDGLN